MTSANIPTTMKAWQYSSTKGGLPKNLQLNSKAPIPKPTPTQHLVKVHSVALNPVDYKPAENALLHRLVLPKPATPGIDFVGEIVKPAAGSSLKAGELVFGMGGTSPFAGGILAEYGIVKSDTAIPVAGSMSPVEAASIGVAGLTALQSILPNSKPGNRIFINGGSGGTGLFGIQFAKALGCDVTVTCSTRNVELCRSLGAEVIDYTKGSVLETLKQHAVKRKYDLVIDNIYESHELYWKAHEYTNSGAKFVVIAGAPTLDYMFGMIKMKYIPSFLGGGRRKIGGFFAQASMDDLARIRTWVAEKKVKPVIDQRFPFEQAVQAFEKLKTKRAVGKIVIDVYGSEK